MPQREMPRQEHCQREAGSIAVRGKAGTRASEPMTEKRKNLFSLMKDCKVLTQLWAQWRGGDSPKDRQNASHKTLSLLRKREAREIFLKGEEKPDVYSHHQREGRSKWIRNQRLNIIGLADKAISNSLTASIGVCWTKQRNLKVLNKIGSFHL